MDTKFLHEYDFLPWVDVDTEVTILYYDNYWDGPMSGMLIWNGQMYWFDVYKGFANYHKTRRYVILELSEEELLFEEIRHQLWVECCGNNCFNLPKDYAPTKPIELFYKTYPPSAQTRPSGKPIACMGEPSERQKYK